MKKLFLILLTVTAFTGFAEDAANEDSKKEADLYVNVTAARELKDTESVPAAVTVITKEDMEGHSVTEALSIYAGIGSYSIKGDTRTDGAPLYRGFSENSQGRVLVLIDGVKLNNPDMSGINWLSIPEERIERIEVLKGGNSALYGNNAVAAVINVITKIPERKTSVTADVNFGSNESSEKAFSASTGGEKISLDVAAKTKKTNGWRERTGYESTDFSGTMRIKPVDKLDVSLSLIHGDSEYELPGELTEAQYEDNSKQAKNYEDTAENSITQISTRTSYELNNTMDINLNASYSNKENNARFKYSSSYNDTETNSVLFSPALDAEFPGLLWGTSIKTGLDYSNERLVKKIYTDSKMNDVKQDTDLIRNTFGIFVRAESYIFEKLVLSISVRQDLSKTEAEYDDSSLDDDKSETPFVYGAGLSYLLAEDSKIYFSYNRVFRYPFFDEQAYYNSLPGLPDNFNDKLDPEFGHNFEAGAEYNALKYVQGGINLYCLLLKDEIAYNNITNKNDNLDETIHYGVESYINVTPIEMFKTRLNYNYTVAEFRDGQYEDKSLTLVPAHTFSIIPELNLFDVFKAYTEISYTGEMYKSSDNANEKDKTDSYVLTNAGVSASQAYDNSDIMVYFRVKNLFDKKYPNFAGTWGYYPGNRREITVGTKLSF